MYIAHLTNGKVDTIINHLKDKPIKDCYPAKFLEESIITNCIPVYGGTFISEEYGFEPPKQLTIQDIIDDGNYNGISLEEKVRLLEECVIEIAQSIYS